MKKRRITIISAALIGCLIIVFGIIGRNRNENPVESKFSTYVKDYDAQYKKRMKHYEGDNILRVYDLGENERGFIVVTEGYEEEILLFVALNDTKILEVSVLYENESEKYGEYVTEQWFLKRFELDYNQALKTVKRKKENDNEVIAITGATITSDAVVRAVNQCIKIMEDINE